MILGATIQTVPVDYSTGLSLFWPVGSLVFVATGWLRILQGLQLGELELLGYLFFSILLELFFLHEEIFCVGCVTYNQIKSGGTPTQCSVSL